MIVTGRLHLQMYWPVHTLFHCRDSAEPLSMKLVSEYSLPPRAVSGADIHSRRSSSSREEFSRTEGDFAKMNFQSIRARVRQQFAKNSHQSVLPEISSTYITERRRSGRVEVETLVAAITASGNRFEGYCRNLSQAGTAALIWGELQVGDQVCLAFRPLGGGQETMIPATVRNSVSHRYGFEFTVPDEAELHRLLMDTCRIESTYS